MIFTCTQCSQNYQYPEGLNPPPCPFKISKQLYYNPASKYQFDSQGKNVKQEIRSEVYSSFFCKCGKLLGQTIKVSVKNWDYWRFHDSVPRKKPKTNQEQNQCQLKEQMKKAVNNMMLRIENDLKKLQKLETFMQIATKWVQTYEREEVAQSIDWIKKHQDQRIKKI